MPNIHSIETLKEKRRKGTHETAVPFVINGEMNTVNKKIENGMLETYELGSPIGEMMTSETARKELVEKVVLDVELGREDVPVLYRPIYETMSDPNFPKEFEAKWAQSGTVIFFEHMEGEEVKFGSLQAESGPIARLRGYTAGFEYTKEMELFNQTFNFEMLNKAFGEAHNAMLNHLHFAPILKHSYKKDNKTEVARLDSNGNKTKSDEDMNYLLSLRETLKVAIRDTRTAKRPGTVLIANSAARQDIEDALKPMNAGNTSYAALAGISDIIYYDGWETNVGRKEYAYEGVPEGKAFLIRPKRGFKELVKQGLQINSTMGDLTRLVDAQIVGDFWRGVFSAVDENVQVVELPGRQ